MKTKQVKARKMWANFYDDGVPMLHATLEKARDAGKHAMNRQPMYVLPADAKSYDAMVRAGALAIGSRAYRDSKAKDIDDPACYTRKPEAKDIEFYSKYARAVLASIGITRPSK